MLRSRSIFLNYSRGDFGRELITMYIARLQDFPSLGASNLSAEVFNMTLQTIAECWKRFVLPTETFPWSLFKLLDCVTIDEFLVLLTDLQAKQAASPCCVDVEFSTPLLKFVTAADTGILDIGKAAELRSLLEDLAVHAPLSSDLVECRHGLCQHIVHRWRGVKPTDNVAAQSVAWQLITRAYGNFRKYLWSLYGDPWFYQRLARFGVASQNQYTDSPVSKFASAVKNSKRKLSVQKLDKLLAFEQQNSMPMPRKVCGDLARLASFIFY